MVLSAAPQKLWMKCCFHVPVSRARQSAAVFDLLLAKVPRRGLRKLRLTIALSRGENRRRLRYGDYWDGSERELTGCRRGPVPVHVPCPNCLDRRVRLIDP